MKEARKLLGFFLFCSLIWGVISMEMMSLKIFKTAMNLFVLNDNAQFYNEQPVKTDEMTSSYEKNQKERQLLYNSEDKVVRIYSNSHVIIKMIGFVIAVVFLGLVPISAVLYLVKKKQIKDKKAQLRKRIRKAVEG